MKYADQTSEIRRTWPEETTRSCLNVRVNETSEHTKKMSSWCVDADVWCAALSGTLLKNHREGRVLSPHDSSWKMNHLQPRKSQDVLFGSDGSLLSPPPPCGNVSVMPLPKTSYITFPSDPFVKFHSSLRWSAGPESALVSTLVVNRGERAALFLAEPRPGPKQKLSKRT